MTSFCQTLHSIHFHTVLEAFTCLERPNHCHHFHLHVWARLFLFCLCSPKNICTRMSNCEYRSITCHNKAILHTYEYWYLLRFGRVMQVHTKSPRTLSSWDFFHNIARPECVIAFMKWLIHMLGAQWLIVGLLTLFLCQMGCKLYKQVLELLVVVLLKDGK